MRDIGSCPRLRFDFRFHPDDRESRPQSLVFTAPEKIVAAYRLEDVLPALQEVEKATRQGFYAAGYVAYEAAPAFDNAMRVHAPAVAADFPLLWFGIFTQPQANAEGREEVQPASAGEQAFAVSEWLPNITREHYDQNIQAIREAIGAGETYQVNYTLRLRAGLAGDDYALYEQLLRAQQPGYGAYLDLGRYRILSASPELFFHRENRHIITRPMKGTTARGRWQAEDRERAQALQTSAKNRAENIMIVDLLRSDLGKLALPGTVRVSELFALERYPTVWQMTSTIEAEIPPDTTLTDIFRALFPCGSVTGAPKIETMRHIARLEAAPRHVYCGAIGLVTPNGTATFSVAIRTLLLDTQIQQAEYGVGGGITWDSTPQDEYAELLAKAAVLTENTPPFDLLETLRLENGQFRLLERHLLRMEESASYFGYANSTARITEELAQIARHYPTGTWRVRLLLAANGSTRTEVFPLADHCAEPFTLNTGAFIPNADAFRFDSEIPRLVTLARSPIHSANRFLYHKTTHREVYETHRREINPRLAEAYDTLLWNERGYLTEFTTGNVVLELERGLWTPPVECGLLAGTFRAELLAQQTIRERLLTPADLSRASRLWLVNSVRGWLPVTFLDFCLSIV